ncbi:AAA-like domain-containing protein [Leptolyngbya sp. CCNP1308]|uniref:WD40 domain-containing protein n=1 Tax=Leptolyngbya sp. CCNP1308 TaxID=3110255 RepID=UPI002B1FD1E6|nr:AAA-like domain-containing protein [Leptolyngbya sp. CCNP1308]MEA5448070.1 AAA-like domain-containing protein [Leptolyngbya sp. CCNP1308]
MLTPSIYKVGGCLQAEASTYVVRQADEDLLAALQAREFCYVFSARQMGKSSLLVRVKAALQKAGGHCAYLDMTRLGSNGLTQPQWYTGVGVSLLQSLNLLSQTDFLAWWQARESLPLVQRLNQLVDEVVLPATGDDPVYIFVDEIDGLLSLDFSTDDFFAWMRSGYNLRAHDPRYRRLTFALFGVATPADLIADKQRTPFNIGQAISLEGFTLAESAPLQQGLEGLVDCPQAVLKAILDWTGGQPFLTQKLCQIAAKNAQQSETLPLPLSSAMANFWVEGLVKAALLDHWEAQDEPIHLRTIRDHLFWHQNRTARILGLYQQLLQGEAVQSDDSREQSDLLLSGLVVRRGNELAIKNRIYQQVFTADWVSRELYRLRPYAAALEGWMASARQDATYLLRGQTLWEAESWARDKSLSDVDYQFLAASQDAERQEIQQKLDAKAESERFFRQLAEAVPQIVWIVEPDGSLSYSNQRGTDFSGIAQDGVQGLQRLEVIHPEDRQTSLRAWEQAFATGNPYEVELRLQDADGQYRWFLNRAVPIRDAAGQVVKWFGTSTDLDEVKRSEEAKRLKERFRLQRWLLGAVSAGFAIATSLGLYAFAQRHQATLREIEAIASLSDAQFASGNRLDALVTALQAQTRLDQLRWVPGELSALSDRELRRATFQALEWNRFNGHLGRVRGLAVSPNGDLIAATYQKDTTLLWGMDGTLVARLPGAARESAFSPDGQTLATAGDDGTVQLWSRDGNPLATLKGHQKPVKAVVFSPDGQTLASAGSDNLIKLWSPNGQLIRTLSGHRGTIWNLAFSPDGQQIASASDDSTVRVWNLDGTLVRVLQNPIPSTEGENHLQSVAFSPVREASPEGNGQTLVAGDSYGNIVWWNADGTLQRITSEHRKTVGRLAFSPDGQTLASGSWDDTIKLWSRDGTVLRTIAAHPSGTLALAFSPDGQRLISGGEDDLVRLWQLSSSLLTTLQGHRASVWDVAIAPDGNSIVSSSSDGTIKLWNREGQLQRTLPLDQGEIWAVDISPDQQTLAAVSNAGVLNLWEMDGTQLHTVKAHGDTAFDVAFNPDNREIVTVGWDGQVKLWRPDGTLIQAMQRLPDTDAAQDPNSPQNSLRNRLNAVAFSPDGQWLAVAGLDEMIHLWRRNGTGAFPPQPNQVLKGHDDTIWDVAFNPDGTLLASASEDTTIKLWSLEGKLVRTLEGHRDRVNAVTIIPPNAGLPADWGTVIASASWDHTVKLWSLDGTLRLTLEGHEERALDVNFYPATSTHGPLLASGGLDNAVILWPLDRVVEQEQVLNYGCQWVREYLQTNPQQQNQELCRD